MPLRSVQGTAAYQAMTADQQAEINAAISSSQARVKQQLKGS